MQIVLLITLSLSRESFHGGDREARHLPIDSARW